MSQTTNDPSSKINLPVIRTDLVSPLKALEIYQEHILGIINNRIKTATRDLKECNQHKNDFGWVRETTQVEEKLRVCKDIKRNLYIPYGIIPQIEGNNKYYFTRELREEQKLSFAWRNRVLINDNFKCRKCGGSLGLEAHHIYQYKLEPILRYDQNNGITFCMFCHKHFHKKYGNFTNMENIISFLEDAD